MSSFDDLANVVFDTPAPIQKPLPVQIYSELAHSIALVEPLEDQDLEDILARFGVDKAMYDRIQEQPAYKRVLADARAFVAENGEHKGFKVKMRYFAEMLAKDIYEMAKSPATEPALRLKMFEAVARYAELEPVKEKEGKGETGTHITINLGQGVRGLTGQITATPAPPDPPSVLIESADD